MPSLLLQADLSFQSWDTKGPGQKSGNVHTSQTGERVRVSGNTVRGFDLYSHVFNDPLTQFKPVIHLPQGMVSPKGLARLGWISLLRVVEVIGV